MKIGDTVSAIDDALSGTVIAIKNDTIEVVTDEGFEMTFDRDELIVEGAEMKTIDSRHTISEVIAEKEDKKPRKNRKTKPKDRNLPPMEVDLHIHKLTNATHLSNYDMLNIQLDEAKRQLEFAFYKRIPKVVFIHGVGAGVLKTELEYLFRRYEQIKFYDADYKKYGAGATEIYIHQNIKNA